jgi:alpha-galactosidase
MATAMMARIHQSGRLDNLSAGSFCQVFQGLDVYKRVLRPHIPHAVPFFPLGKPDITSREAPVALGVRAPELTWVAVWRMDGTSRVAIPVSFKQPRILFPDLAGLTVDKNGEQLVVKCPRPRMACILCI